MKKAVYFRYFKFFSQLKEFKRFFILPLQRLYLSFYFNKYVIEPFHVISCVFQFFLAVFLLESEFRYSTRLFKNLSSLNRGCVDYFIYLSLGYYGISFFSYSRIQKQLLYVPQPALLSIKIIGALSGPVSFSLYAYLCELNVQDTVAVVKEYLYFAEIRLIVKLCSRKYDVFHLFSAEISGALFSKHPSEGVENIALSASIWAYYAYYSIWKLNFCLMIKGFKAFQLYRFKSHVYLFLS